MRLPRTAEEETAWLTQLTEESASKRVTERKAHAEELRRIGEKVLRRPSQEPKEAVDNLVEHDRKLEVLLLSACHLLCNALCGGGTHHEKCVELREEHAKVNQL